MIKFEVDPVSIFFVQVHDTNLSLFQPEAVIDMKQRYVGHCNVGTDIKQASFLGQKGRFLNDESMSSILNSAVIFAFLYYVYLT